MLPISIWASVVISDESESWVMLLIVIVPMATTVMPSGKCRFRLPSIDWDLVTLSVWYTAICLKKDMTHWLYRVWDTVDYGYWTPLVKFWVKDPTDSIFEGEASWFICWDEIHFICERDSFSSGGYVPPLCLYILDGVSYIGTGSRTRLICDC